MAAFAFVFLYLYIDITLCLLFNWIAAFANAKDALFMIVFISLLHIYDGVFLDGNYFYKKPPS